jgi:hypothetical protein
MQSDFSLSSISPYKEHHHLNNKRTAVKAVRLKVHYRWANLLIY